MLFEFPVYANIYALAAVLSLISAAAVLLRRTSPGSLPFSLSLLSLAVWSFASLFEAGAQSISGKIFSSIWQYIGITTIAPLWLYFCAEYAGNQRFLSSRLKYLVWIFPIITMGFVITNSSHGLIWKNVYIPENAPDHIAVYEHGILFYIFAAYVYVLLLLGTVWLVKKFSRLSKNQRTQVVILIASVIIGWMANFLYLSGFSPIPGLDLTPLSFVFIALVLTWFIFSRQLFDLLPVARTILVDNMTDGVIVLDEDGRVVDLNQAAIDVTNYQGSNPVGLLIWDMYKDYLPLIDHLRDQTDLQVELELPSDPPRFLDVKIDSIGEASVRDQGQVITIRDVTNRKKAELEESDQRKFAEALTEIAAAVNSTLILDDVLDKILDNVGKVVPHDTANIALVNDEGILHFRKTRGYEKYGYKDLILGSRFRVAEIPNMKKMVDSGSPCINQDTHKDPDWRKDIPGSEFIRSYLGAPIISHGRLLGFINLDAASPNYFTSIDMSRLQVFANQAAVAIQNAQLFEEMELLAITDSLTGLYNRRFFFEFAENEIEKSKRYNKDLSMIMMDIDHFKKVNDRFGHQVGDQVLKNAAKICQTILRKADMMCRFGGEEFIVMLPETGKVEAVKAAERMCRLIAESRVVSAAGEIRITVSIGVSQLGKENCSLDEMISSADKALYAAKDAGRNCVRAFSC